MNSNLLRLSLVSSLTMPGRLDALPLPT